MLLVNLGQVPFDFREVGLVFGAFALVFAFHFGKLGTKEGQVVAADYTPRADTEVVFVLADRKAPEERLTTNKDGEFRATLAEGHWDVYVKHQGGPAVLQKRIEVGPKAQSVTLLSK